MNYLKKLFDILGNILVGFLATVRLIPFSYVK